MTVLVASTTASARVKEQGSVEVHPDVWLPLGDTYAIVDSATHCPASHT